jgi:hypothetical protein
LVAATSRGGFCGQVNPRFICVNLWQKMSWRRGTRPSEVSAWLKAPVAVDRKFEDVVKSAQDAAVLVLVY